MHKSTCIPKHTKLHKSIHFALLVAALTLVSGCSDDADKKTGDNTCTQDKCENWCGDFKTDKNHCGNCETQCNPDEYCDAGSCKKTDSCKQDKCENWCGDFKTDKDHCGNCETKCNSDEYCDAGSCKKNSGPDTPECDEQTKPECSGKTERTVCEDGKFVIKPCAPKETCSDGACVVPQDETECSPEDYKVVCDVSGEARIVCSEEGKTVREECPDGRSCVDGECRASCTEDMMSSCEGDVATRCEKGLVIHEDCAAKGMACAVGECIPLTNLCISETFQVKCREDGKAQIVCRNGLEVEEPCQEGEKCEGGVCQIPGETCEDGTSKCLDDKNVKKCVDGAYVSEFCGEGFVCLDDECKPSDDPDKCLGNEPMCGDSEHKIECQDGKRVSVPCKEGKVCDKGECVDPVVPGSNCDDTFVQYCLDETSAAVCQAGTVVSVPCGDKICQLGTCSDKPCGEDFTAECASDDSLRVCREGAVKVEKCEGETVCLNGECRELGEGDTCKPDEFSSVCLDKTEYYVCGAGNTIEKKACESTQVCLNGMCSECDPETFAKTCDPNDETGNRFIECVEDETTPGLYVKKAQACPKSMSVCLEGACVECDPQSYKAHCSGNAESKCSTEGKILVTPCTGDLKCVEGFSECTSKCTTAADCPTRDDGLKYLCVSNQCELQTECSVSDDKPTCSGDMRKVCQDPGKWVEVACDGGKVCQGQGECVICTQDSHCTGGNVCDTATNTCVACNADKDCSGSQVCDVPTHTCVACNADTDCSGSQVCDVPTHTCVACNADSDCGGSKACLNHACVDCNPATYGTQCVDNAPATCNSAGTIVKSTACSGQTPLCIDGGCAACNAAEDLNKVFSCNYPGYEGHAAICKGNTSVSIQQCADNQTCVVGQGCVACNAAEDLNKVFSCNYPGYEGHAAICKGYYNVSIQQCTSSQTCVVGQGCVSKCNESPKCLNIDEVQECDASGNLVPKSCWPFVCGTVDGVAKCTDTCSGNIDKCGTYEGMDILRTCKDNKVTASSYTGYFCGTVDGVTGWHKECSISGTIPDAKYGLDSAGNCQVWRCEANGAQDYKGNPKNGYVVVSDGAICLPDDDGVDISLSCYKTVDNVAMGQYIMCDTTYGATCSKGVCSNWVNVTSELSAENKEKAPLGVCDTLSTMALNYYKIGDSYYLDSFMCRNFMGGEYTNPKCKTVYDDRNQPRAICDHVYSYGGINYTMGGICQDKTRYHLALYKESSGFGMSVYSQTCENSCKTTSTGFAYCGN